MRFDRAHRRTQARTTLTSKQSAGTDVVVDFDGERFSGVFVDHVQQLQAPMCGSLVELKVQRPHMASMLGSQLRSGAVTEAAAFVQPLRRALQMMSAP